MASNKEHIEIFMMRSFEKSVDFHVLSDKKYKIPKQEIHDYLKRLLSIPFSEYIDYIKSHKGVIKDDQLTQSSNFAACSSEMCEAIIGQGNPGMKFLEIGQLFPQYIKQRNDTAFRKYGENQVKTSAQLGLTFEYYDYWYLTCVGYVYNELEIHQQRGLLARTVLRVPLYQDLLLHLLDGNVNLADYMKSFAPSTQGRRSGSIIRLLKCCLDECNIEGIVFHDLYYPIYVAKSKSLRSEILRGTATRHNVLPIQDIFSSRAAEFENGKEKN